MTGRSRGGLTTQVHALVVGRSRARQVVLTRDNVHEDARSVAGCAEGGPAGRGRPQTRLDHLIVNKGYRSKANRLRARGIAHTIPEPHNQQANRRQPSRGGRRAIPSR